MAARKTGDVAVARPFVVAVPVLVAAVLGCLVLLLIGANAFMGGRAFLYWLESDLPSIRDLLLVLGVAFTVYAGLCCAFLSFERVRLPGPLSRPAFAQAAVCGLLVFAGVWFSCQVIGSRDAEDYIERERTHLASGQTRLFEDLVGGRFPGIEALARELFDEADPDRRFLGAAALHCLGDRSPEVKAAIRVHLNAVHREVTAEVEIELSRRNLIQAGIRLFAYGFQPSIGMVCTHLGPARIFPPDNAEDAWDWWVEMEGEFR